MQALAPLIKHIFLSKYVRNIWQFIQPAESSGALRVSLNELKRSLKSTVQGRRKGAYTPLTGMHAPFTMTLNV